MNGFLPSGGFLAAITPKWFYVTARFSQFLANLKITDWQLEDGTKKQAGVRACLNRAYWGHSSETLNSMLIGSWGKLTRVRPSRDVDILFLLPPAVYHRYQQRTGNRQSDLLQEVKNVLTVTYSQTDMRGDGQVVVIPFNSIMVEVAPGFRCNDGSIIICDTHNDGSYVTSTAEAEARDIGASDAAYNGNTRALARMMKQWQREKDVPLKSFQLERLAVEFLQGWRYKMQDYFWYDWMVRDFFAFLLNRANTYVIMPGTAKLDWLGDEWFYKAMNAHAYATLACMYEQANNELDAGEAWQGVFGTAIPRQVA